MTRDEKVWAAWFATTACTFAYLEARAIRRRDPEGTLTHATRKALGIDPQKPWRLAGVALVTSSSVWLTAHLITGQFVPEILSTSRAVKAELVHDSLPGASRAGKPE